MHITEPFIRRPVMTTLVMLGLLFFGIISYFNMPVSYLPSVDYPTIQVSASLPGANPTTMASNVASPLERQFSAISGLTSMSSENSQGSTSITLQFDLDVDINDAAMDVQAKITKATGDLPMENMVNGPPSFDKVNPSENPIMYMIMTSDTLPLSVVNDYAKTYVTQSISMAPGVAQVLIYGEQKYSPRIYFDPRKLGAKEIGIDEVVKAVNNANVDLPLGNMEGTYESATLQADGQLYTAEKYRDIIVAYRDGRPIRLKDLAQVKDGIENDRFGAWYNGRKNIVVAVKRQPGSNTIEVVEGIRKLLPKIHKQLPASIIMEVTHDQSEIIKESVDDVKFTLQLAVALVVMVVFIFLRNISSTIIAGLAIPFSIIATFAAMHILGYTLDTISLMALTLCVGFVVDDAIVVLENIVRHMEMGKKPFRAAIDGSREIGFTIVSMTLSLAVVFIPVMFMAGIIGRVLHEFAMTITVAILLSGVVSLSLTPMLASRILKTDSKLKESDRLFDLLVKGYKKLLHGAINHRFTTFMISMALLGITAWLFLTIPKGFLPNGDLGYIMGFAQARQGISYTSMRDHQLKVSPVIRSCPAVEGEFQIVSYPLQNQGMTFIMLKSAHDRKLTADQTVWSLWPQVNRIPGLQVFLTNPPLIDIGGKRTKGQYMVTLQCPDTDLLYAEAAEFADIMKNSPMFNGVISDLQVNNPEIDLNIDRDRASALGLSAKAIEDALFSAYGQRRISTIYAQNDDYKVITELAPEFQRDASALSMLYVRNDKNNLVRLDEVTTMDHTFGPAVVSHTGQLPSVSISFNTNPGISLGQATAGVDNLARKHLDDSISTSFEGTAGAFEQSMGSIYFLLVIAVVVIYIILGILYESFFHPITILSGLPSAAMGGLLTLHLFGKDLDLYGIVGLIMLMGIVKKNSIMVVDFALQAEARGETPRQAAFDGSVVRFRPIIMTTLAAIMGALPIAVGYGAGAEARQPLGMVVVGGLIFSQFVTLFITPVYYTYLDQLQSWLSRRGKRGREARGIPDFHSKAE